MISFNIPKPVIIAIISAKYNVYNVQSVTDSLISLSILFWCCNPVHNEKNDKFYRKVAFLMYTEMVNFRPLSLKAASKLKPHRGMGTMLSSL